LELPDLEHQDIETALKYAGNTPGHTIIEPSPFFNIKNKNPLSMFRH
jgi:hypothetical protein